LFAKNTLLEFDSYKKFVQDNNFSIVSIQKFASTQNVKSFIVIGRLQNDGILEWSRFTNEKTLYKWAAE